MSVKRLTIELPVDQYDYLQKKAKANRKTIVGIIRQLIEGERKQFSLKHSTSLQTDPLYMRTGSFDGPRDLSDEHDNYLYGKPQ